MLIIEDGSIVANADSYVTRADYITYAASFGITIADAEAADIELRKAAQFIDSHESQFMGYKVNRDQTMAFPRYDVVVDNWWWTHQEIPRNLILCQMAYALDVNAGIDLWNRPVNPNLIAKRKKVEGAVEVEYAVDQKTGQKMSRASTADALLKSLMKKSGLTSMSLVRA